MRLADLNPGPAGSNPRNLTDSKGALFFTANDGVNGPVLFKWPDDVAPTVAGAEYVAGLMKPSVQVGFLEDVSASLRGSSLSLGNLTTGATIDPASISLAYDPATNVGTFTFPGERTPAGRQLPRDHRGGFGC